MSEGNHKSHVQGANGPKQKMVLIAAGTAVAILASGVLFQIFRAENGAGPDQAQAADGQPAGSVRLGPSAKSPKGRALAAISLNGQRILIAEQEVARESMERVAKNVLDSIINRTIIQLACEEQGIAITEAEVSQEVIRIAQEFNIPPETWYQMLQSERDLTPAQYHRDVIWPMLALRKLAGKKTIVTDDDLQREFMRLYGPRVKASMIMLDNLRRANDVWEQAVKNPEDFGRLARKNSVDPSSRPLDGQIPPIPRFSSSEEIEKAAFKLRDGEISGIIQFGTPARYVILKCEGRTEQRVKDISEVRDQLVREVENRKIQESAAVIFDQLKQQARVDNYLINTTTGGYRQTSGSLPAPGNVRPAAASSRSTGTGESSTRRKLPSTKSPVRQQPAQNR